MSGNINNPSMTKIVERTFDKIHFSWFHRHKSSTIFQMTSAKENFGNKSLISPESSTRLVTHQLLYLTQPTLCYCTVTCPLGKHLLSLLKELFTGHKKMNAHTSRNGAKEEKRSVRSELHFQCVSLSLSPHPDSHHQLIASLTPINLFEGCEERKLLSFLYICPPVLSFLLSHLPSLSVSITQYNLFLKLQQARSADPRALW